MTQDSNRARETPWFRLATRATRLQAHAVGVIGDGAGPVREYAADADVASEYVEHGVDVAVVVHGGCDRAIEVVAAPCCERPGPLERPGDDVEPGRGRGARLGRRPDAAVRV